jgi:hypothetical protein
MSVALGGAPAIGEAIVGIVSVAEDFGSCLIELVGDAAILVVIPSRCLAFAIGKREQVASGIVRVANEIP